MRQSFSPHISNMREQVQKQKKAVLHIPPFVLDDVRNLSLLKAPESRLTTHRDLTEN